MKYRVTLGRLVRESASVVVDFNGTEKELHERLNEVYDKYDGEWEPDTEWGCEPSDSHVVDGPAENSDIVEIEL